MSLIHTKLSSDSKVGYRYRNIAFQRLYVNLRVYEAVDQAI